MKAVKPYTLRLDLGSCVCRLCVPKVVRWSAQQTLADVVALFDVPSRVDAALRKFRP